MQHCSWNTDNWPLSKQISNTGYQPVKEINIPIVNNLETKDRFIVFLSTKTSIVYCSV